MPKNVTKEELEGALRSGYGGAGTEDVWKGRAQRYATHALVLRKALQGLIDEGKTPAWYSAYARSVEALKGEIPNELPEEEKK